MSFRRIGEWAILLFVIGPFILLYLALSFKIWLLKLLNEMLGAAIEWACDLVYGAPPK